jgi:tRNA A-37 threonylcarbamoyl transferase component Bud32
VQSGLDNLALFMAQLEPRWAASAPELYSHYLAQRGEQGGPGSDYLQQQIEQLREWRWGRFRGKLFRDCTSFRHRTTSDRLEIVSREHAGPEMDALLSDPDASFPGKEEALKNGATCTVWATQVGSLPVVIKRYNSQGRFKGLIQKFVRGRAMESWENSHLLGFYGVSTPRPLAVLKKNIGWWETSSYFLTEEMDGICIYYWLLDEARTDAEKKGMVKKVAELLVQLRAHKISHGDMKVANWFVVDNEVVLIDLDTMKKYRSSLLFRRAWRGDLKRFMKNWRPLPDLFFLFRDEFRAQGLEWR